MDKVFCFVILLMANCVLAETSESIPTKCFANNYTKTRLLELKANEFQVAEDAISALAQQMRFCLAEPDPVIRDEVAYQAYVSWLRNEKLAQSDAIALFTQFSTQLKNPPADPQGVYLPFIALVFAEVVRVDRISPYLNDAQRQIAVDAITTYLSDVSDFRGYESQVGWRHAVAHSADAILQLALNPAINQEQIKQLAHAIKSQIVPAKEHFYIYGEPERLARATAYLMLRNETELTFWQTWLAESSAPQPFENWQSVFNSQTGLAKRHNVKLFLANLNALISSSKNPRLTSISENVSKHLTLIL